MMCSVSSRAVIPLEGITGTCQLIICGCTAGEGWTSVFVCAKYADDMRTQVWLHIMSKQEALKV